MDNLLWLLIMIVWVLSLPKDNSERENLMNQLSPRIENGTDGLKVSLFPSRASMTFHWLSSQLVCNGCDAVRRLWSAVLPSQVSNKEELFASLQVFEGLAMSALAEVEKVLSFLIPGFHWQGCRHLEVKSCFAGSTRDGLHGRLPLGRSNTATSNRTQSDAFSRLRRGNSENGALLSNTSSLLGYGVYFKPVVDNERKIQHPG